MTPEELVGIFQRITRDEQTPRDIETLRSVLIWTGSQQVVQSGSVNINIGQGRDIQILNYSFSEQQTEIIRQFLEKFKETSPHNLRRSGVRQFVGRDRALKELDRQLQESERVAISTLTGMAGQAHLKAY
jgi:hypothetical protein